MCSPSYLAQRKPLLGVPGESGHTLLHLSDAHFDPKTLWGTTTAPVAHQALLEFSDYCRGAAGGVSGGGVAPGWISVVSRPLLDGTLVPASHVACAREAFHLLAARGKPLRDVVVAIRDCCSTDAAGHGTRGTLIDRA